MKVKYAVGDWFAIPLRNGGVGIGLVARATKRGPCILTYLFGPKRESIPTLPELSMLRAENAVKVLRSGDLHLIDGRWPIIGRDEMFTFVSWPFPKFLRSDEIGKRDYVVTYSEDDPIIEISEVQVPFGSSHLERNFGYGAGAVEIALTKMLEQP